MRKLFTGLSFLSALLFNACSEEKRYPDALSPEETLESFQLHDGFAIELFASEPYVQDPVSMIFDEQGNVYVVEMPDYPYKPTKEEAKGRIKVLRDTDHDGKIDDAVIFVENISEATSVLPWKGGLLVTAAPNILYMKDTDGDFKADSTEILFTGFFENNSEAQITNLRFGVDNWIYASNNGQAGEVSFNRNPEAPKISMRGGDFRFRLDEGEFEVITGGAQFGQAIDDWGHRFITQNTLHIRHVVVPGTYLERNPNMPSSTPVLNISDHDLEMFQDTPPPYWRAERTRRRQEQYEEQGLDRVEYAEDHFTGSSGGTFYGGDAFPSSYYGNIFTGDVAGNLVHRDVLTPLDDSPTYVAKRDASETDKEFLSSTDPWFRPANLTVGPDGYLYLIDMYRQHIETPVSIPEDLKEDMDFMNGSEMGRIYRIKPSDTEAKEFTNPNLKEMESAELVELLAHSNQWWRLQAQRLLLERQDESVVPAATTMFETHEDPRARLHALYVLEGLDALTAEQVKQAMQDEHPGVREHGVILSERFPALLPELIKSVDDPSPRVAFQASLSLGEFSGNKVASTLAEVVEQKGQDPWFKTAVLSSAASSSIDFMNTLSEQKSFFQDTTSWKLNFVEDLSYAIGAKNDEGEIISYLNLLEGMDDTWQTAGVEGMVKSLNKSEDTQLKEVVANIEANADGKPEDAIAQLKEYFSKPI